MEHDMNLKQRFRFTGAAIIILALAAAPGGFAQETIDDILVNNPRDALVFVDPVA